MMRNKFSSRDQNMKRMPPYYFFRKFWGINSMQNAVTDRIYYSSKITSVDFRVN